MFYKQLNDYAYYFKAPCLHQLTKRQSILEVFQGFATEEEEMRTCLSRRMYKFFQVIFVKQ